MANRNIVIPIDLTKTGGITIPTENKVVYTSDTVNLTFNLTGIASYIDMTASVSLVMKDGSAFQHEKPITENTVVFSLKPNEVQHAGVVVGQIALTDVSGTITSQEFIFTINPFVLDASESLGLIREVEVDNFETLKVQVEGIHTAILANWDTIQADLEIMEAGYASDWNAWFTANKASNINDWSTWFTANKASMVSDWSTWFTTNTNSITAEWIALKAEINANQTAFTQDIAIVEADEAIRVSAEAERKSAETARKSEYADRANEFGEYINQMSVHDNAMTTLFNGSSVILSIDEYTQLVMTNKTLPTVRYIITDDTLEEFLGAPLT